MEPSKPAHILFVDDDDNLRTTFAEALRAKGFLVTEKLNGEEALLWLRTNLPAAVISGILMPRLGGFELMERLKTDPGRRNVPFFFFSHLGRPEDRERAKKLGAKEFFVYGFASPNDVAASLQRTIASTPALSNSSAPR